MNTIKIVLAIQNCIAGDFDKNLAKCFELSDEASRNGGDIIVFPEMNLTGYVTGKEILHISKPLSFELEAALIQKSKSLNMTMLIGLAERSPDGNIYASHLVVMPDGSLGKYRKIHTSPYEKTCFTPGNDICVFKTNGFRYGVQLCYDAHFPELSLSMAQKRVDAIFIPHASPRGDSQRKFDSWMRHLRARAYDNSVFIFANNQTGDNNKNLHFPGVAVAIGPDGNVLSKSLENTESIHMVTIKKDQLLKVRSHEMGYFLPNRRSDLFNL
jgi:predicted amidohydrolase